MSEPNRVHIFHDKRGYYTLRIDGKFCGNFDTIVEASKEAEQILWEKEGMTEAV